MNLASWQMHDMGDGSWAVMGRGAVLFWGLLGWAAFTLFRGRGQRTAPANARELLDRA